MVQKTINIETAQLSRSNDERESKFDTDRIERVSVDSIDPHSKQARIFIKDEDYEALKTSIEINGDVNEAIKLIRVKKEGMTGFRYQVISGERRWQAVKELGLKKVKAIIVDDPKKAVKESVDSNELRKAVHPINRGIQFMHLLRSDPDRFPNHDAIGRYYNIKGNAVSEYIRYAKIPQELREIITKKDIRNRSFLRSLSNRIKKIDGNEKLSETEKKELIKTVAMEQIENLNRKIKRKRPRAIFKITEDPETKDINIDVDELTSEQKIEIIQMLSNT